jgi:hypothetical protein
LRRFAEDHQLRGSTMSKGKLKSGVLRRLAEGLLQTLEEAGQVPFGERADLATSLVRQWVTYDGHAFLFLGGQGVFFDLGMTPLGRPRLVPEPGLTGWLKVVTGDWKVDPGDLPEVFDQLNRGQSAEVTNAEGVPLRLWVNPQERKWGLEPLVQQDTPPGTERDYHKIAANELEAQLGGGLDPDELDELACSVARQWQRHEGHACLLLDGEKQLVLTLTEKAGGDCTVNSREKSIAIEPALVSLGLAPEAVPEVLARINLGQEVEFLDRTGVPSVLWHDPRERRIHTRPLSPSPQQAGHDPPSIFCPRCGAVLNPWPAGGRQQSCPLCGPPLFVTRGEAGVGVQNYPQHQAQPWSG